MVFENLFFRPRVGGEAICSTVFFIESILDYPQSQRDNVRGIIRKPVNRTRCDKKCF